MYNSTITEYEDDKDKKSPQMRVENENISILDQPPKNVPAVQPLIWRNIIGIAVLHYLAIYMFVTRFFEIKLWTWIFGTHLYIKQCKLILYLNFIFIKKNNFLHIIDNT